MNPFGKFECCSRWVAKSERREKKFPPNSRLVDNFTWLTRSSYARRQCSVASTRGMTVLHRAMQRRSQQQTPYVPPFLSARATYLCSSSMRHRLCRRYVFSFSYSIPQTSGTLVRFGRSRTRHLQLCGLGHCRSGRQTLLWTAQPHLMS